MLSLPQTPSNRRLFTLLILSFSTLLCAVLASGCGSYAGARADMGAPLSPAPVAAREAPKPPQENTEKYVDHGVNPWTDTKTDTLSTFAIDVDTGAYTISRRKLLENTLPPKEAVRVEEFVNYFRYGYTAPDQNSLDPLTVHMEATPAPTDPTKHIVRVGLQGRTIDHDQRRPANLVFLVDVSGSMDSSDKLGLAKDALIYLTEHLQPHDTVALVTYAGSIGVVLPPTPASDQDTIIDALDDLTSGGSTAMASGLQLAYEQALLNKEPGTLQRVIVISDGDANVGATTHGDILSSIRHYVNEGVTLSCIGVGMGNYQDHLMEQLANQGNGNYYYLDSFEQAQRVFGDHLVSTLQVIARDVKVQVEWNPARVSRYRLIGYENRDVADKDFRNDRVDGGEVGAGHQVTALYEVELAPGADSAAPLGQVHMRYKAADARPGDAAKEQNFVMDSNILRASFDDASPDTRLAVAIAGFAEVLRHSPEAMSLAEVERIAQGVAQKDSDDHMELLALIRRAIELGADQQKAISMAH